MRIRLLPWFTCLSALVACGDADPAARSGALTGTGTGAGLAAELGEPSSGLAVKYTEYLGQLTGRKPNSYSDALGMAGTDLGISFQRDDTLYFLFGDTWTRTWEDTTMLQDPIATTGAVRPTNGVPKLEWITDPSTKHWLPLLPGAEPMGEFNLPVEGIPDAQGTYLFFHTAFDPDPAVWMAKKSILAFAPRVNGEDQFGALQVQHEETNSTRFLSVSAFVEDGMVYIFGAGKYRYSPVHLARVALDKLKDRSSWEYWAGEAGWLPGEGSAKPIMNQACVGELSVRKHARLGYLMTYNCKPYQDASIPEAASYPHAIQLRVASQPQGPWSAALPIVTRQEAERRFVHAVDATPEGVIVSDDGLGSAQEVGVPGDLYGPYLVPAWFDEPGPGLHGIVYTISSWRPYEVHLLRTVLAEPGYDAKPPAPRGQGLPRAELKNPRFETGTVEGWKATGLPFRVFQDELNEGKWTVESAREDVLEDPPQLGSLAQTFTIDAATSTLSFRIYGARNAVVLLDGDDENMPDEARDVLRWTEAPDERVDGVPRPLRVSWNLETLRGKRVKLVIKDDQPSGSAFIAASDFRLE